MGGGDLSIKLSSEDPVPYLNGFKDESMKDLRFLSKDGNVQAINRCVAACGSNLCFKIFQDLYTNPVANSDDVIVISTNFSDCEIQVIMDFFECGILPSIEGKPMDLDLKFEDVFRCFGLDLLHLNAPMSAIKSEGMEINPEYENQAFDGASIDSGDDYDVDIKAEVRSPPKERFQRTNLDRKAKKGAKKSRIKSIKPKDEFGLFDFPNVGSRDLQRPYQCPTCVRGFHSLNDYRQHFLRHKMEVPERKRAFTCLKCMDFSANTWNGVVTHQIETGCNNVFLDDTQSQFFYNCYHCNEVTRFEDHRKYLLHVKKMHKNSRSTHFVCAACGSQCVNYRSFDIHKSREGPFHVNQCSTCGHPVTTWEEHQKHVQEEHDGEFLLLCGLCGQATFRRETDLRSHKKICKFVVSESRVPGSRLFCVYCKEEVTNASIRNHIQEYHFELKIDCPQCQRIYFSQSELEVHLRSAHPVNSQVVEMTCPKCGKKFKSKAAFEAHMLYHEPMEKRPVPCPKCDKRFVNNTMLNIHMKVHDDYRPDLLNQKRVVCEQCGASVLKCGYERHMQSLHGELDIKCELCDSRFKSQMSYEKHYSRYHKMTMCKECGEEMSMVKIKQHMLTQHTAPDKLPFICNVCNPARGFITRQKYLEHSYTHSGERPFICKYCPKTFTNSSNRAKHVRESHPDKHSLKKK